MHRQGDYGLPPSRVAALFHAGLVMHYANGAYYPAGGGQAISDALVNTIERSGGSIHLRHVVEAVDISNGRAVGVKVTGPGNSTTVKARAVVRYRLSPAPTFSFS